MADLLQICLNLGFVGNDAGGLAEALMAGVE